MKIMLAIIIFSYDNLLYQSYLCISLFNLTFQISAICILHTLDKAIYVYVYNIHLYVCMYVNIQLST